ncbi:MAG: hypothetical protein WAX07_01050 [Candidatus Altiarchaeia archaeon]
MRHKQIPKFILSIQRDNMSPSFSPRILFYSSFIIAVLVSVACTGGILVPGVYYKESVSWATQGTGQDILTLGLAVPALLFSALYLGRSLRALLVWLGVLLYLVYSYLLYASYIHFGVMFPVYVAILGLSFYTLLAGIGRIDLGKLPRSFVGVKTMPVAVFLFLFAFLFAGLWITDIAHSILSGITPESVMQAELPVNPVHVLDLSFLLPGMLFTAVLLSKRKPLGFLFGAPMLTFSILMGAAIISMQYLLESRRISEPSPVGTIMGVIVLISLYLLYYLLKDVEEP